ncbi:MAG TPA: condensation domain-containing protein, partial [Steroidobacteraceae bacterium]
GRGERELQLLQWGSPKQPEANDESLHQAFERIVADRADAVALVGDGVTVSFEELNARSTRLARVLVQQGVEAGEVIAIRLSLGIELVTMILASLKAGCGYALIDSSKSLQRQSWMVRHSGAKLLIEDSGSPGLPLLGAGMRRLSVAELLSQQPPATVLDRAGRPHSTAVLSWGEGSHQALSFSHRSLLCCGCDEVSRLLGRLKGLDTVSLSLWGSLLSGQALDLKELADTPNESLGVVSKQLLEKRTAHELYVVKDYELVPIGTEGELWLGGKAIAEHVCADPSGSAARWMPHPFSQLPGERLFNTGLKARFRVDGALEIGSTGADVGQQASLNRIGELLRAQSRVRDVAVECAQSFGGPGKIVAYCVFDGDEQQFRSDALARLRQGPQLNCLPAAIVAVADIPRHANGRVDFSKLPSPHGEDREASFEWPVGPCEELLAGIWSELLKCGRVSRHANFFKLGGHSLVGMRLVGRIRDAFGVELPLRAVFECADLKSQAHLIQSSQPGVPLPPIRTVDRSQPLPLSFAQQRLWFLSRMMPPNAVYNISLALKLRGALNEAALLQSLSEIVKRHEALRTRFVEVQGQAVQVIDAAPESCVVVEEVHSEEALRAQCAGEREHCFDLSREPLYRLRLIRTRFDGQRALLVTFHHVIADGWSLGLFFRELSQRYRANAKQDDTALEPLPIQYADYAHWQRRLSQGEVLQRQLDYWRVQLANTPPALDLPTDLPRPAAQSHRGDTLSFSLSAELSNQLQHLSRKQNATLFMTLLAAFSVLLCRRCAQEDVIIGTPIANRTRREAESLIGFFVNMLVLRCDLSGHPTFKELLTRTREMALQSYAHQDVPFEHLVEVLKPGRSLNRSPLFQVVFAMQNTLREPVRIDAVEMSPLPMDGGQTVAHYDLTLNMSESATGITGLLEYCSDLFSRESIQNLASQYIGLLEQIANNPQLRIDDYELVTRSDERVYREAWGLPAQTQNRALSLQGWSPTQVVAADENGEHSAAELSRRVDGLAQRLATQGVQAGQCIGIPEDAAVSTLVAWLALRQLGAVVYFMPSGISEQRRRFVCESAGIVRILDSSDAGADASDRNASEHTPSRQASQSRAAIRIHVRHASGKLLAAQLEESTLLHGLLRETSTESDSAPDRVWAMCGMSRPVVSMLRALARGERWEGVRDRHTAASESHDLTGARWVSLPSVVLEGRHLAPVATAGELCLEDLTLLQASDRYRAPHPLRSNEHVVKTGHGAVVSKDGGCRLLTAPDGESSRREERLARDTERRLLDECDGRVKMLAMVAGRGQWTVFAEPGAQPARRAQPDPRTRSDQNAHADPARSDPETYSGETTLPEPFTLSSVIGLLKRYAQPQLLPVALVLKDTLPLSSAGAVDRDRLHAELNLTAKDEAPQGMTEELLADIWRELLKCGSVSRTGNFFELGGSSLVGVQLLSRIREVFAVELALRELFEHQTLLSQARLIAAKSGSPERLPAIRVVDRQQPLSLSFAQHRLWFLSRMMPPNAVYNIPLALRLRGEVNETALLWSLNEIVRRHEALRTRFVDVQGQAVQVIDAASGSCVVVEDIQSEAELHARCITEREH